MKALIILPRLSDGGAEKVFSNISLKLKISHDILVWEDEIIYEHNADKIIRIGNVKRKGKIGSLISHFFRKQKIKKIRKTKKYDFVLSGLVIPNILNVQTRKYGGKTILTVHNNLNASLKEKGILGKISKHKIKKSFKKADQLISVSEEIRNTLIKDFNVPKEKVSVINNSVEVKENTKEVEVYNFNDNDFNIISIGRLNYQKGQWHQLNIIKKLKETIPNVKLHIYGEGPLKEKLNNKIKDLGLTNNIVLQGFTNELQSIIKKYDLMIFTSIFEGFGNVIIEAMSQGVPVVSTNCKVGPSEIITNGINGYLTNAFAEKYNLNQITKEDEKIYDEFIGVINELKSNDELYNKIVVNGKTRSEDFSIDKIIIKWNDILKK